MGKRKRSQSSDSDSLSSDEYESLRKSVKKLKRKLYKRKPRRRLPSSPEDSHFNDLQSVYDYEYDDYEEEPAHDFNEETVVDLDPELPENTNVAAPPTTEETPATSNQKVLDPDILMMLGDDPSKEIVHGEDLHEDIAARWTHSLINGLHKDARSDLMKQYLPAKNCANMTAPKLNLEVKAAITDFLLKKDIMLQSKQNQISCCLVAVGKVLKSALSENNTPQVIDIIKPLGDAGRLLCDLHFKESLTRRFSILKNLNKDARTILRSTKIDENLFGNNLTEHLKSSKAVSKSGLEMKANSGPSFSGGSFKPPPLSSQNRRGALNSRGVPPRHVAGEPRPQPAPRRPAATAPRTQRQQDFYRRPQRGRRRRYSPQPQTSRRR